MVNFEIKFKKGTLVFVSRKTWENEKSSSETLNLYIIQYRKQKRSKYTVMEDTNILFLDGTTVHVILNFKTQPL